MFTVFICSGCALGVCGFVVCFSTSLWVCLFFTDKCSASSDAKRSCTAKLPSFFFFFFLKSKRKETYANLSEGAVLRLYYRGSI